MVTIKEIAEELGVSTTTVSNVIHGKTGKMSADTRKKIEEALVRYHYVADYRTEKRDRRIKIYSGKLLSWNERKYSHGSFFVEKCWERLKKNSICITDMSGVRFFLK